MDRVRDETSLINSRLKHCSSPVDMSRDNMLLRSQINFLPHLPLAGKLRNFIVQIFLTGHGSIIVIIKINGHSYKNGIK